MNFLKNLLYNLSLFHSKYGWKGSPVSSASWSILIACFLYSISIVSIIAWLFFPKWKSANFIMFLAILLTLAIAVTGYCILFRNNQYMQVIEEKQRGSLKNKIATIAFLCGSIIMYVISAAIMCAMNNNLIHPISFI